MKSPIFYERRPGRQTLVSNELIKEIKAVVNKLCVNTKATTRKIVN